MTRRVSVAHGGSSNDRACLEPKLARFMGRYADARGRPRGTTRGDPEQMPFPKALKARRWDSVSCLQPPEAGDFTRHLLNTRVGTPGSVIRGEPSALVDEFVAERKAIYIFFKIFLSLSFNLFYNEHIYFYNEKKKKKTMTK